MKSLHLQALAAVMAGLFFIENTILMPLAEASLWSERQVSVPAVPIPKIKPELFRSEFKKINPAIPLWIQEAVTPFATIQGFKKAKVQNEKTIILIQDAHLHLEAQTNIAGVLTALGPHLETQNKKILVGLEGTDAETINFDVYNAYPYRAHLKESALACLREKILSGAELAAIGYPEQKSPFVLTGIEDQSEYDANIDALQAGWNEKEKALAQLQEKINELNNEKKKVFSNSLQDFDIQYTAYKKGFLSVPEYVLVLDSIVPAATEEVKNLIEATLIEGSIDFEKVELERSRLLHVLLHKLPTPEVQKLAQLTTFLKSAEINSSDYYRYLQLLMKKRKIDFSLFPEMNLYVQYVLKTESINSEALFAEISEWEIKVKSQLAQTTIQKDLLGQSEILYLAQKLIRNELTEAEWKTYSSNSGLLREKLPKQFESFYKIAFQRSHTMAQKMAKKLNQSDLDFGLLIAGGFHANGIQEELVKNGFNVISISPRITTAENEKSSLDFLASNQQPLDALFVGSRLFLNSPPVTAGLHQKTVSELLIGLSEMTRRGLSRFRMGSIQLRRHKEARPERGLSLVIGDQQIHATAPKFQRGVFSFFGNKHPFISITENITSEVALKKIIINLKKAQKSNFSNLARAISQFFYDYEYKGKSFHSQKILMGKYITPVIQASVDVTHWLYKAAGYREGPSDFKTKLELALNETLGHFMFPTHFKVNLTLLEKDGPPDRVAFSIVDISGNLYIWVSVSAIKSIAESAKPLWAAGSKEEWAYMLFFFHEILHSLGFSHEVLVSLGLGPKTEVRRPEAMIRSAYQYAKKNGLKSLSLIKDPDAKLASPKKPNPPRRFGRSSLLFVLAQVIFGSFFVFGFGGIIGLAVILVLTFIYINKAEESKKKKMARQIIPAIHKILPETIRNPNVKFSLSYREDEINPPLSRRDKLQPFEAYYEDATLLKSDTHFIWDQKGGYQAMVNDYLRNKDKKDYRLIILQTESEFIKDFTAYLKRLETHEELESDFEKTKKLYNDLGLLYHLDRVWYLPDDSIHQPVHNHKTGQYDITGALKLFKRKATLRKIPDNNFVVVSDWRKLTWNEKLIEAILRFIPNVHVYVEIEGKIKLHTLAAKQA